MNEITINTTDQIILKNLRPMSEIGLREEVMLVHCGGAIIFGTMITPTIIKTESWDYEKITDFIGWIPVPIYRPNQPDE